MAFLSHVAYTVTLMLSRISLEIVTKADIGVEGVVFGAANLFIEI